VRTILTFGELTRGAGTGGPGGGWWCGFYFRNRWSPQLNTPHFISSGGGRSAFAAQRVV